MHTTLLVGTTKGAFLITSEKDRADWQVSGPFYDGWPINHMISDGNTIWAGGGGDWEGAGVWRSDDRGQTWTCTKLTKGQIDVWAANDPGFAAQIGWTDTPPPCAEDFSQVWSLNMHHGTLYAGTKPATFLVSHDRGATWQKLDALNNHPSADSWNPGAAGLTLHTIVRDPDNKEKLWIGISAAGVFATEDSGQSWERRNRLSNAEACDGHHHPAAPANGETGHCVHNMVRAPSSADRLYQQNHHGVWRSNDGGGGDLGMTSTRGCPRTLASRSGCIRMIRTHFGPFH